MHLPILYCDKEESFHSQRNIKKGPFLRRSSSAAVVKMYGLCEKFLQIVKKFLTNLYSSKASSPDCIPVVVLKNYEPELSYILAELFNMCLKESFFLVCGKVLSVIIVLKNVGERFTTKNCCPVTLLSVFSKIFEKLVNNRLVDHLEENGQLFDFQYGFRSSLSINNHLTVVSDRIARYFNKSGTTGAAALDISKAFGRVWQIKLKSYGILVRIFGLILSFLRNRWLRVGPQGSIIDLTLFLLYINDLPEGVICNIAIYVDDTFKMLELSFPFK